MLKSEYTPCSFFASPVSSWRILCLSSPRAGARSRVSLSAHVIAASEKVKIKKTGQKRGISVKYATDRYGAHIISYLLK